MRIANVEKRAQHMLGLPEAFKYFGSLPEIFNSSFALPYRNKNFTESVKIFSIPFFVLVNPAKFQPVNEQRYCLCAVAQAKADVGFNRQALYDLLVIIFLLKYFVSLNDICKSAFIIL